MFDVFKPPLLVFNNPFYFFFGCFLAKKIRFYAINYHKMENVICSGVLFIVFDVFLHIRVVKCANDIFAHGMQMQIYDIYGGFAPIFPLFCT